MKIKNNKNRVEDTLDLHGCTRRGADELLYDFLDESRQSGFRKVRIVTGWGLHSENFKGVLREHVENILNEEGYNYSYGSINDGGSGVLDVFIK